VAIAKRGTTTIKPKPVSTPMIAGISTRLEYRINKHEVALRCCR
jgi:hypothetical protein